MPRTWDNISAPVKLTRILCPQASGPESAEGPLHTFRPPATAELDIDGMQQAAISILGQPVLVRSRVCEPAAAIAADSAEAISPSGSAVVIPPVIHTALPALSAAAAREFPKKPASKPIEPPALQTVEYPRRIAASEMRKTPCGLAEQGVSANAPHFAVERQQPAPTPAVEKERTVSTPQPAARQPDAIPEAGAITSRTVCPPQASAVREPRILPPRLRIPIPAPERL